MVFNDERSTGLIKGVSFGVVPPGVNVLKTLYLFNTGATGDRILDISIQSRIISEPPSYGPVTGSHDSQSYPSDTSEALHTLTVPTVHPITVSYGVEYRRILSERPGLADLASFNGEYWDDGEGGEALVRARMETTGPYRLHIESVKLIRHVSSHARGLPTSRTVANNIAFQDGEHARVVDSAIDRDNNASFPTGLLFFFPC
jgi:trafficking protein particle complex subunit 11